MSAHFYLTFNFDYSLILF